VIRKVLNFIPLGVAITGICGLIYFTGQQIYRQSANDPQVDLSENYASRLGAGAPFTSIVPLVTVDLEKDDNLYPFVMTFDINEKNIGSTARLNGQSPSIPGGILEEAKVHGYNQITWEPQVDIREAVVIKYYKQDKNEGYVLVGRSLREVDNRVEILARYTIIVWFIIMVGSTLASLIFWKQA
jgi:hypothetical protein